MGCIGACGAYPDALLPRRRTEGGSQRYTEAFATKEVIRGDVCFDFVLRSKSSVLLCKPTSAYLRGKKHSAEGAALPRNRPSYQAAEADANGHLPGFAIEVGANNVDAKDF